MIFCMWLYIYDIGRQQINTINMDDLRSMFIQMVDPSIASMLNDERFMELMVSSN